jgi:hypothetical protein
MQTQKMLMQKMKTQKMLMQKTLTQKTLKALNQATSSF